MSRQTKLTDDDWSVDDPRHPDSDVFRERRPRRKKDTRRWCKGREGREHVSAITKHGYHARSGCQRAVGGDEERWICWHVEACTVCGKILRDTVPCPDKPVGTRQLWVD